MLNSLFVSMTIGFVVPNLYQLRRHENIAVRKQSYTQDIFTSPLCCITIDDNFYGTFFLKFINFQSYSLPQGVKHFMLKSICMDFKGLSRKSLKKYCLRTSPPLVIFLEYALLFMQYPTIGLFRGVLPYMGHIGMCGPKGCGFQPFSS